MPTYITLIKFTQDGMRDIKESPSRLDAGKQLAKSLGGDIKEFFLTTGRYDAIAISEGPDDEAAAKMALILGSMGSIRTETLRAFTEDEYRKIIASLP